MKCSSITTLLVVSVVIFVAHIEMRTSVQAATSPSSKQQPVNLTFPQIGPVAMTLSRPMKSFPTATFTNAQGKLLFRTLIGKDNQAIFRVNPLENEDGREMPLFGFISVDGPTDQSQVVLIAAMYAGTSDCEYEGTVIGVHDGQIRSLLPKQAFTHVEGGMYVGDLGQNYGYGFAVWNFIWNYGSEGHADPHRYNVKLYRYDGNKGEFVKISDRNTTHAYARDEDALGEFGLHLPNQLLQIPIQDFGC